MKIYNDTFGRVSGSTSSDEYSKSDSDAFSTLLNKRSSNFNQYNLKALNEKLAQTAFASSRMTIESAMNHMEHNAITEKNSMLLKARGNSVKKATEVAKDISF